MHKTIYIDAKVKDIDQNIADAIKKAGIVYPHESLAFFKAIYAKFEEANSNKVMLAQSVEEDVPQLVGCQMNRDHRRYGSIMGQILSAYINSNNEIEIVFSFHKSVYSEEYKECLELMKNNKLTVSFELKVANKDIEVLSNGVKKLHRVSFDGVGLLMGVKPAYKNAYALDTASQKSSDLIYAKAIEESCKKVFNEQFVHDKSMGDKTMDEKAKAALLAKFKEDVSKELGSEAVKDWTEERWEEELAKRASAEQSEKEEAKVEPQEEKAPTEVIAEGERVIVTETKQVVTETILDNSDKIKVEVEEVVKVDNEVVKEEKVVREVTYTYAEMEAVKAEYETKLKEKDSIIASKDEAIKFIQENAKKIVEIRNELGEFGSNLSDTDLLDETKLKIARLEKENASLKHLTMTAEEKQAEEEKKVEEKKVEEKKEEEKKQAEETKKLNEDLKTGHDDKEVKEPDEKEKALFLKDYVKGRYNKIK